MKQKNAYKKTFREFLDSVEDFHGTFEQKTKMNSPERDMLQIVLPSGLLHSVTQIPFSYVVLANDEEIEFEKLSPIVLKISFESGTDKIEIVGFDN